MGAQKGLMNEVLIPGYCVACGACAGLCPYLVFHDGRLVCLDSCDRMEGTCYEICPRTPREAPLEFRTDRPLGRFQSVRIARSALKTFEQVGQYGGTVSTLLALALGEGLISRAVVTTGGGENGGPRGIAARSREEVLACAGSRYVGSGSLSAFNACLREASGPCGVAALPCQAQALTAMRALPHSISGTPDFPHLVIGLFCTWALDYRTLARFLASKDVEGPIHKYDIPPPPADVFQLFGCDRTWRFPLESIRPMILRGCTLCADMTGEDADVSVGALESASGWNTLIVRTPRGKDLVDLAERKGLLEIGDVPESSLSHLEEASLAKRARGIRNERMRGIRE